jgi:hypothetical protein
MFDWDVDARGGRRLEENPSGSEDRSGFNGCRESLFPIILSC